PSSSRDLNAASSALRSRCSPAPEGSLARAMAELELLPAAAPAGLVAAQLLRGRLHQRLEDLFHVVLVLGSGLAAIGELAPGHDAFGDAGGGGGEAGGRRPEGVEEAPP